jgi:hypothetical protein
MTALIPFVSLQSVFYYMLTYTDCWELMKSMASHGSSHGIAIHDEGDGLILCGKSHKVIVCTHSFRVTSKCCSGVFLVISWI